MEVKNQHQRNKIKNKIQLLDVNKKINLSIKLYSEGTTLKLLAALFKCDIIDLVNLFIEFDIKYCTGCNIIHSRNDFHKKDTSDGLNSRCYRIIHEKRKYYYELNKEQGLIDSIKWKKENSERVSELRKNRNQLPEVKKKNSEYMLCRRHNDDIFRLRSNFSNLISNHLKNHSNITKNNQHWEELVGYSLQNLVLHLENQFKDGMTWDNYGKWHVDHIIPVSYFNIVSLNCQDFKDCWSLDNLQPLWAEDNLKKSNSLDYMEPFSVDDLL
jgi:hypothetical protein